ncbi:MAG: DUF5691 domain-containing protein [Leptolyngbyaceae cyanobacterium bins.302]|nr:DUF5691 domain-containing protein [Leptolyngbyaceae cyanobacterium bins.302]
MVSATDSPWQAIASAALIGTERQPFQPPIAPGKLGQVLAQLSAPSSEAALLAAAATVSIHQRVGGLPETRPIASASACSIADAPRCHPRAVRCLHQILQGQYPQLLNEWLELAAIAGQRVPEMDLPALLDKGRQQRELRSAILAVLGQRGRWLAAQNPDWSYAVALSTDEDWETGTTAARLMFLQDVRSQDPDRARALLQSSWSQEAASDRAKFLETLHTGLSLADEPFLEEVLSDRSKEVRRIAVDLLANLPDSRFCQQVTEHTCRYLSLDRNQELSLQVQLPDHLDNSLIQLGLELKPSSAVNSKLGEKAWWLLQMIGATPLNTWIDRWQMTPQEIVQLTKSHDWQTVVLDGFAWAAKRQSKDEWLEAIFKLYFAGHASFRDAALINLSVEDLFNTISPDRRDTLLLNLLQTPHKNINDSLTIWLLRYSSKLWRVDLAQLVLQQLEEHLTTTVTLSNSDWELKSALREFARFIPVSLTSEAIQLHNKLSYDSHWKPSMNEFIALLTFRQEIKQAFEFRSSE